MVGDERPKEDASSRAARCTAIGEMVERARRPEVTSFPISGPCAEALGERKAEAGDRELLYGETGDGRWLHVRADRELVEWVMRELVDNVFRHATGWSRIAMLADPVTRAVRLTIRDDGAGMYGPLPDGRGGLRAVREIVAAAGGTLDTRSTPDGGVLHVLRLPSPPEGPYGSATRPYRHPRRSMGPEEGGNPSPRDA